MHHIKNHTKIRNPPANQYLPNTQQGRATVHTATDMITLASNQISRNHQNKLPKPISKPGNQSTMRQSRQTTKQTSTQHYDVATTTHNYTTHSTKSGAQSKHATTNLPDPAPNNTLNQQPTCLPVSHKQLAIITPNKLKFTHNPLSPVRHSETTTEATQNQKTIIPNDHLQTHKHHFNKSKLPNTANNNGRKQQPCVNITTIHSYTAQQLSPRLKLHEPKKEIKHKNLVTHK
eukprot:gene3571-2522_t